MAQGIDVDAYFADDWETPKKTAKGKGLNKITPAGDMIVMLDLQTIWLDDSFNPKNLKANIIQAVERVTSLNYNITDVYGYAMLEDDEEPAQHKDHVSALSKIKFCELLYCTTRNLRCVPCKSRPRGRKEKLCELEMVKDLGDIVLWEKDYIAKTAFFIASNDFFFNEVVAESLVSQGFAVYTGRVKGMLRRNMFRDVV